MAQNLQCEKFPSPLHQTKRLDDLFGPEVGSCIRMSKGGDDAMETSYVMEVDGAYRITGSRVSLYSVVYDFLSGLSPESIADNYDTLTLEQVYGAITYYLAHRT